MKRFTLSLLLIGVFGFSFAQDSEINPKYLSKQWDAWWITHPTADLYNYGVFHFRKDFRLEKKPEKFIIHVSADNRYRLYVNGKYVVQGPARGDFQNWFYETVDIAKYLKSGLNCIAAQVWNAGEYRPLAQISDKLGFLVQGNSEQEHVVNTDTGWKVIQNEAFSPHIYQDNDPKLNWQFYVAGVMDSIAVRNYPFNWEQPEYDFSSWADVRRLDRPRPLDYNYHQKWIMAPRQSALLEEKFQRFKRIVRVEGIKQNNEFVKGYSPIVIPPNSIVTILFDHGILTNTNPELIVSKGAGSKIVATYAEALFNKDFVKEHRDKVEGMIAFGVHDIFMPDGGDKRKFMPLWTKPYRWVQFEITTKDEELVLEDYYSFSVHYPTKILAEFECSDEMLQKIWDASIRTQILSAQETFVSDLAYEQIQYAGDTKVQELCYQYMTGNEELFKLALKQFNDSRSGFGLTQSRYPCHLNQFSPLYSLVWISMCHDYLMLGKEPEYLDNFLPGIYEVLHYYTKKINNEGMVPTLGYLDFIDSEFHRRRDSIRGEKENQGSTIHSLSFVIALREAADIFEYSGKNEQAREYRNLADKVVRSTKNIAFDVEKGFFSDSPSMKFFSQHANILAVLSGAIPKEKQSDFIENVLNEKSLKETQMYFHFFLGRAINKAGAGDLYLGTIDAWRNLIDYGVKTFGEFKNVSPRSECHAWSTSPAYEFLATVCGIQPTSPGFKTVEIKPYLGDLEFVKAKVPHHNGFIQVYLEKQGEKIVGKINLPENLPGEFIWNENKITLKQGENVINI